MSAHLHHLKDWPGNVIARLKTRSEFLRAATGRRWSTPNFTLQCIRRDAGSLPDVPGPPRLGFTVTKKIGQSVERNRVRRRLKAAIDASQERLEREELVKFGHDYVILARPPAISSPFAVLLDEVAAAFAGVHRPRSSARSRG